MKIREGRPLPGGTPPHPGGSACAAAPVLSGPLLLLGCFTAAAEFSGRVGALQVEEGAGVSPRKARVGLAQAPWTPRCDPSAAATVAASEPSGQPPSLASLLPAAVLSPGTSGARARGARSVCGHSLVRPSPHAASRVSTLPDHSACCPAAPGCPRPPASHASWDTDRVPPDFCT